MNVAGKKAEGNKKTTEKVLLSVRIGQINKKNSKD